tara:strand:+ start:194 stop:415 length:222 start_codon:yes stop_codon:yes gene_type:complete
MRGETWVPLSHADFSTFWRSYRDADPSDDLLLEFNTDTVDEGKQYIRKAWTICGLLLVNLSEVCAKYGIQQAD